MDTNQQITKVNCNSNFTEIIMAEFAAIGYESFQETETGFITFADPAVAANLVDDIIKRYKEQAGASYTLENIVKENWNKKWEEGYEPILVEDKCIVRASFHPPQPNFPIEIIINPKMSFGTGHHETTYLMMKAQLSLDHNKKAVLDAGCGTGILSVLAKKLGSDKVIAYDNDNWVIENVQENFKINHTQGEILLGTIQKLNFIAHFDIILANINKNVLLQDIPFYAKLLKGGGHLLLSGFYESDLPEIKAMAEQNALQLVTSNTKNDWAMAQFLAS